MNFKFTRTDVLIWLVVLIWGSIFSVIKYSLQEITPLAFVALRFACTSLLLLAIVWLIEGPPRIERQDWGRVIAVGLTSIGIYQLLFTVGLRYTTASNSSLIIATAPIWTALFGTLLGSERVGPRQVLGIALSFTGVALIVQAGSASLRLDAESLQGDLLSLGAAASTALSAVLAKGPLQRYSSLRLMTWGIIVGTLFALPLGLGDLMGMHWGEVSLTSWLGLGYSIVFASVIGYVFWFKGIGDLGATKTMVYGNLIPVVAVLVAALTLGEKLTLGHLAGGAIILTGVTLTRLAPRPTTPPVEAAAEAMGSEQA